MNLVYFWSQASGQLEATIKALEQERDHYRQECEMLKSLRLQAASPSRLRNKVFFLYDLLKNISIACINQQFSKKNLYEKREEVGNDNISFY